MSVRTLAAALLGIGIIATSAAQTPSDAIREKVLANGLRVIVKEDHRAPVVMTQLWYKVGSAEEHAGKTGLSHALEHMMFKGTKTVPAGEYSKRISALGGSENAYTDKEETVYHVNIAAQHLPEVLKLEADRMANLNFSDDAFHNEIKVIREERRWRIDDNPDSILAVRLDKQVWQKSPNRTEVIGEMGDLFKLTPNDLRQWYRQWYAPNNATLIVVGDVQPENVFRQAEQYFGSLKSRPLPARQDLGETEVRSRATAETKHGATKRPLMLIAYRVPHLEHLNDTAPYALNMLANVLDGHSAARFGKHLVRGRQIAQSIDTSYSLLARTPQLFMIAATPADKVSPARLKTAIEAEIADIAQHGVTEAELQRARTLEAADTLFGKDSISNQAALIGNLQTAGFGYRDEAEIRRRIQSVSASDIQAAAKMLVPQRQAYTLLLPNEEQENGAGK